MIHKDIQDSYNSGLSISEIAKKFERSPSGVKYILCKEGVIMRSISESVRIKHHTRLGSYTASLEKNIPDNLKTLYVTGLALYWGEGSKSGTTVAIANSDPDLILVFLDFLRTLCHIDEKRLYLLIHYHSDQNEEDLIAFWSKITKIQRSQFYASTLHRGSKKESTKRLKFGTISLRYSDSILLKEILSRIEEIK